MVRALYSIVFLSALLASVSIKASAQTPDCDYCCCGCFIYSMGSCNTLCACYRGLPAQNGNNIDILSCSSGFCGCCSCCGGA